MFWGNYPNPPVEQVLINVNQALNLGCLFLIIIIIIIFIL